MTTYGLYVTPCLPNAFMHMNHQLAKQDGWFPEAKDINKLDQSIFIPALKELLLNPNGEARSAASYALLQLPKEQVDQI